MTKNQKSFSVSDRVLHAVYGLGTISRVDDDHIVIEFDLEGQKKFVTSIVQLEHSDVEAPPKTRSRARKATTKK